MKVPDKLEDITLDWLNDIFQPHGVLVHDFKFLGEASNGKGFMGTLERVDLQISNLNNNIIPDNPPTDNITTESLSVILKTLPNDPFRRTYAANDGFCSREVSLYTEIFKEWDKFLDSRQVPQANRFRYPRCYFGAEEGTGDTYKYILVLENLTVPTSHYQLWTPGFSQPLPWPAASAVIRQLARFHATGIAYKLANHIESYYYRFPKLNHVVSNTFQDFWNRGFQITKDVIHSFIDKEEIPNGLMEQLDRLRGDEGRDLLLKWFTDPNMDKTDRSTICHHDLHSNNLVISMDYSKAIMFDYQACCPFNPMKDLGFLLLQNCELDDMTVNLRRALSLYHEEFKKTFLALNMDFEYSLETIARDYDRFLVFSLTHIMTGAPIWITGTESNDARKKRFSLAVIDAFKRGVLHFPTEVLTIK